MIRYRSGENASLGGLDITIGLTPQEAAALQGETHELADWFDSLLYALVALRTGQSSRTTLRTNAAGHPERDISIADLQVLINDLDKKLMPRVQGVHDALIRLHKVMGGSLPQLATAMDVSKSTAQSRRNKVTEAPITGWEEWAIAGGPQDRPRCQACGWSAFPADALRQTTDGYLIHVSHTQDPKDGFYGTQLAPEPEAEQD